MRGIGGTTTVKLGAGAGQHYNIGQERLAQIVVMLPCLEEQQKIADFLSTIDEMITSQNLTKNNLNLSITA